MYNNIGFGIYPKIALAAVLDGRDSAESIFFGQLLSFALL